MENWNALVTNRLKRKKKQPSCLILNNVHLQKMFSPNESFYNLGDSHGKRFVVRTS